MNFFSNVLDSIPVVGHVKGVIHYAVGDDEGGSQAMYRATRTSAVLGGGAAGCIGGPAGAALGAMYAGLAMDGVASVVMDEAQGIIKGCNNIGEDIYKGENPTGSILSTGFQLGMDGVGGLGMGGVSSAASQISEKAVAKTVEIVAKQTVASVREKAIQKTVKATGEEVVKRVTKVVSEKAVKQAIVIAARNAEVALVTTHVAVQARQRTREERKKRYQEERDRRDSEHRAREERDRQEQLRKAKEERDRQEQQRKAREKRERRAREKSEQTNSGPPQPPQGNKNNKQTRQEQLEFFAIFMEILTRLLQRVFGNAQTATRMNISSIFSSISPGQIPYFATIIERLINCGILEEVVEIVIRIFTHLPDDISFLNFISFLEFVAVYITDEISYRTVLVQMDEEIAIENDGSIQRTEPEDLQSTILAELMNLPNLVQTIIDLFETLRHDIESEIDGVGAIVPWFRDIFCAVYHYYKHKCVPGDGTLSVREYCDWIRLLLSELGSREGYTERLERQRSRDVRGTVVLDMYVTLFGRRVRIVVKFEGRTTVLSSCFVVEIIYKDDKEGDVIVNYYPFNF